MMRKVWLLALIPLAACQDVQSPTMTEEIQASVIGPDAAPLADGAGGVIVVLGAGARPEQVAASYGLARRYTFKRVLNGFATQASASIEQRLLHDPRVKSIQPDRPFSTEGVEPAPSWGLDRLDQRSGLDGSYTYTQTGRGVTVYLVDTGIRYTHHDFGGRAVFGYDAFGGDGVDCQGHGTHVAGTIGGATYGVAKDVSLVGVRVLNCSGMGTTLTVLAGLDWVATHASAPAAVNMSLGGSGDSLVDLAVQHVIGAGITVVVAAGNSTANACDYSPARVPKAYTVGATDSTDARASWSNWGLCVDVFAPGVNITSDAFTGDNDATVKSGTSMAAPHVTGAAALYLEAHPTATPAEVAAGLAGSTTKGVVSGGFSAYNDLIYTGNDGADGTGGDIPPTASFTASCGGGSCTFTDGSSDADGSVVGWQWDFGDHTGDISPSPTHTYAAVGTYHVTLIVRDDAGVSSTASQDVTIGTAPPPSNAPPTAAFDAACVALACDFQDGSSDPDGTITQWSWQFGDGASSVTKTSTGIQHQFPTSGRYTVTLTVTDNAGASTAASHDVTVGVLLSATSSRQKGRQSISLNWTGAQTTKVDVYLDGSVLATVKNSGAYTFQTSDRGKTSHLVRVCETAGICSADVGVSF